MKHIYKYILSLLMISVFIFYALTSYSDEKNVSDNENASVEDNTNVIKDAIKDQLDEEYTTNESEELITTDPENTTNESEELITTQPENTTNESEVLITTEPENTTNESEELITPDPENTELDDNGIYTTKEDVARYLKTYGHLPTNFITKKEAQSLGWSGGSLEPYDSGKCIGGSYFGNYEGLLPEKDGREYYECDIDTLYADSRGAKRIVYSNDGLIYYTDDHYESFTLLYGGE